MGTSLTMIDRHYGHLARDGREHAGPSARRAERRTTATVDAGGRCVDAEAGARRQPEATEARAEQEKTRSPLTDSNRRPPLYEEGPCVKSSVVVSPSQGGCRAGGWRAVLISLSPPRVGGHGRWEFAPVAHLLRDRQAARGSVAPLGAKGWLRVSMCQIASVSRRARSTWATLAPRCLPRRVFVRW